MLILLLIFTSVVIIDFFPLVQKKDKKAVVVFVLLFLFALVYNILVALNVDLTSTLMMIIELFKSLGISYPPPS